jgi:hypothetical protein
MYLLFHSWKTIIHLKKKKLLDIAFNDNTTDDEFLQTIASDSWNDWNSKPDFIFYLWSWHFSFLIN